LASENMNLGNPSYG